MLQLINRQVWKQEKLKKNDNGKIIAGNGYKKIKSIKIIFLL